LANKDETDSGLGMTELNYDVAAGRCFIQDVRAPVCACVTCIRVMRKQWGNA